MIDINLWKENIVNTVKYFSNKSMQTKRSKKSNLYWNDPNEFICMLFDDNLIDEFLASSKVNLNTSQHQTGKYFLNTLEHYMKNNPHDFIIEDLIKDPEWDKVVLAAQGFFQAMSGQKKVTLKSTKKRGELIGAMKVLSDYHYQKEVWVNGILPEDIHGSYVSIMHLLYSDKLYSNEINAEIGDTLKNENEAEMVSDVIYELDNIFKIYGKNLTDKEYINLPEWKNVLSSARKAYQYLNADDN